MESLSSIEFSFSNEQKNVFNKYIQGENIFITGPGGSGKSAIIKEIYKDAKEKGKIIQVCALTGCAAVLLQCNATTIHSWGGIGQGSGPIENIIKKVTESRHRKQNWINTDILIIDEVSMMSLKLFELLDTIGKKVRKGKNHLPFGGIQIIFSGDFYQLPPVGDIDEIETSQFCFVSLLWDVIFKKENQIALVQIFRQTDSIYATILNQLREGKLKRSSYEILLKRVIKNMIDNKIDNNKIDNNKIDNNKIDNNEIEQNNIQPTKLFPRRNKVEMINQMEMNKLCSENKIYKMKRIYDTTNININKNNKNNINKNNIYYTKEEKEYEFNYLEKSVPSNMEVHLKIGAQVMCIVNMETSCGIRLCNGSQGIIIRFNDIGMPIIKFHGIEKEVMMDYHIWASESIPNVGVAQIPLILAWALTIHKSQGTTLDLAEIDIGNNVFECGQTYVALSRVKSLEGLYLSSFNYTKILTSKKVKAFYSTHF